MDLLPDLPSGRRSSPRTSTARRRSSEGSVPFASAASRLSSLRPSSWASWRICVWPWSISSPPCSAIWPSANAPRQRPAAPADAVGGLVDLRRRSRPASAGRRRSARRARRRRRRSAVAPHARGRARGGRVPRRRAPPRPVRRSSVRRVVRRSSAAAASARAFWITCASGVLIVSLRGRRSLTADDDRSGRLVQPGSRRKPVARGAIGAGSSAGRAAARAL